MSRPTYMDEIIEFVKSNIGDSTVVLACTLVLLSDPASYTKLKSVPPHEIKKKTKELLLTCSHLIACIDTEGSPISRELISGEWVPIWRHSQDVMRIQRSRKIEYQLAISFSGHDRQIAEAIAKQVTKWEGLNWKVFYDEFEKTRLWGQDLASYLWDVYYQRSEACMVLFSHAYLAHAWPRHELRSILMRLVNDPHPCVLPVAIDKGAIPDELSGLSYWTFIQGEESTIAEQACVRINEHSITYNVSSIEEVSEDLTHVVIAEAVTSKFNEDIIPAIQDDNKELASALNVILLGAICRYDLLSNDVRALLDYIFFSPGAIGNLFNDNDLEIASGFHVRRLINRADGIIFLHSQKWTPLLQEALKVFDDSIEKENYSDIQ